jgi:hypothetical protein
VVYLTPTQAAPDPPLVIEWMERPSLDFTYHELKLWEVPTERMLAIPDPDIWPLAGLMASVTVERAAEIAERIVETSHPQAEKAERVGQLILLAGIRLPWKELLEALRSRPMTIDLWEASSMGREYYEHLKTEALAEGRAEGLEAGKSEGLREMARAALEGKFGALDEEVLDALNAADEGTSIALVSHLITDSLAEARARMGLG